MKKIGLIGRFAINVGLMVVMVLAVAVASHFLLRAGTRHGASCAVPQFKGVSLAEAEMLALENELNIVINDSLYVASYPGGTVLDQLPAAGVKVKPGRAVYVIVNAYGDRMVEIPYVAGRSLRQAKNMLDVAGLEIRRINYVEDMATNYVLEQSYRGRVLEAESAIEAALGSGVELTVGVSSDNPRTRIPNVIGLSLKEAKSRIWESGLNVGRVDLDPGVNIFKHKNAKVYIQSQVANTSAAWGLSVNITMAIDEEKIAAAVKEAHKAELEYEKLLRNGETGDEEETQNETESSDESAESDNFFE